MNIAVILGTSKSDGNTRKLADSFVEQSGAKLFDLSDFNVSFYDYSHENENDDFLPIIHELLSFDHLVFASPVYWYSMSAQLKVFFDRLSDLLTIEKELGRRLKGKSISVLSTGYNVELPDCFVQPFELTAKYMQLEFKGCEYLAIQTESDLGKVTISAAQAIENVT
ncbi:NAD(P)H-dependent oxidoreductase [Vibrio parahaemolyticus]|uniref:flavodoxin family protein n=1 Tax=Vibrio parahaemolyticus TaxID=670 RepID=UPI001A2B2191|nr:NAD(P)H-dependent oxidoreductase [Vibrio parahaemolyticus]EHW0642977.1 NAD(P)H-dependent oxidoreductase [Vibrio parahaemolyticus]EHZ2741921.1 NAD(P)H-dependent oxidoreductase [Vibrio parahaemolyticus]MBE4160191.1 NAD(P)H-dependent oxidoreductase [Vibrio parahaemolyticus]MDG2997020.1 NAD(P)H-dependent oxidoreductase [Vibrio parahaemolyticus]HAS6977556.1 FMN reductase [Vibrio parahaemolyticus]